MEFIGQYALSGGQKIRADRFTTQKLPPEERFSSWQRLVGPVMDVEPETSSGEKFRCGARGFDLGAMHFLSLRHDAMRYSRTQKHLAMSGIDHWCVSVIKTGRDASQVGSRIIHSSPGSLQIKSLANAFDGRCSALSSVSLYLSRDRFINLSEVLDAADHTKISGAMGGILKECMLALDKHIRRMTVDEICAVGTMFSKLIEAAVHPTVDNLTAVSRPIAAARFNIARQYIYANLSSKDLNPASLCKALGVSRRLLYHLFEPQGGVAKYILRRRLAACCAAIADQSDSRLISTIAYSYGFTDSALFSRQFYAEYGFRPSEARAARLGGHLPLSSAPNSFSEWLLQVRENRQEQPSVKA